jgi:predicted DNA-binding protein with PD1-like motif
VFEAIKASIFGFAFVPLIWALGLWAATLVDGELWPAWIGFGLTVLVAAPYLLWRGVYHRRLEATLFDEHLEVAACVGNLSDLDGEPFAHTHAVLSRPDGESVAGHLDAATVFAGEVYVKAFDTDLVREHDERTDLDLWL